VDDCVILNMRIDIERKMMRPILLEIVSKMLTTFDYSRHCRILFDQVGLGRKLRQNQIDEYPSDLKEECVKLSNWIQELKHLYKHRLLIKLIDAQSPLGIYKSLRHWINAYPTFIIERKETFAGWDKNQLEDLLDKYIKAPPRSKYRTSQPTLS
jgi:hypothetical protein